MSRKVSKGKNDVKAVKPGIHFLFDPSTLLLTEILIDDAGPALAAEMERLRAMIAEALKAKIQRAAVHEESALDRLAREMGVNLEVEGGQP